MDSLKLFRKRFIPDECIFLKDDILIRKDAEHIITKWNTLHSKAAFSHGSSCYFLKEGFKLSKLYRADNSLLYWYCDIAEFELNEQTNTFIMTDLLADVVVYPDGEVRILDLDELSKAHETGLLTDSQLHDSLNRLHKLLSYIYAGRFGQLQTVLENLGL